MKYITFINDKEIPALGLGTWQLTGETCKRAVSEALDIGYRYIDTAAAYGNQKQIGEALKKSSIERSELFITSKVFHPNLHKRNVLEDCDKTLQELNTDYLDLYLIHWPNRAVPLEETIEALRMLQENEKIAMIGVSNFTIRHLEDLLTITDNVVNNQVEFHPSLNQDELKRFCDDAHIVITAYSPLAHGHDLRLPLIGELAKKYGRSEAQVIINWLIGKGMNTIPRTSRRDHLEDNFKSLEWDLSPEDVQRINAIGGKHRVVKPHFHEFDYE